MENLVHGKIKVRGKKNVESQYAEIKYAEASTQKYSTWKISTRKPFGLVRGKLVHGNPSTLTHISENL